MPRNERLIRTLVILGIFCALIYIGQFLWEIGQSLSDLILLLAMAWLVAYVLTPIAQWLSDGPVPKSVVGWVHRRWGDRPAERLLGIRVPYSLAALSLYLLVLLALTLSTVLAVPGIIKQLRQLATQIPNYIEQFPDQWEGIKDEIVTHFDVDRDTLEKAVPIDRFTREATEALPDLLGNAVTVVQGIATGVANTLLILILSLYIMLDGKRLSNQLYRLVPMRYQDEMQFVFKIINRTFGGFLRGQVLMGLLQGIFTGVVMRIFGLQFTMITSIVSGLLMFIPELGAPIAMLAPPVASTLQGSDATIPLLIIMFVFQQLLLRFIIPKIMSEAIGMPPLLILVSVLVSAKVMGLWGFFFGIPVAGAIYTIAIVALEKLKHAADAQDRRRQSEKQARQSGGSAADSSA